MHRNINKNTISIICNVWQYVYVHCTASVTFEHIPFQVSTYVKETQSYQQTETSIKLLCAFGGKKINIQVRPWHSTPDTILNFHFNTIYMQHILCLLLLGIKHMICPCPGHYDCCRRSSANKTSRPYSMIITTTHFMRTCYRNHKCVHLSWCRSIPIKATINSSSFCCIFSFS